MKKVMNTIRCVLVLCLLFFLEACCYKPYRSNGFRCFCDKKIMFYLYHSSFHRTFQKSELNVEDSLVMARDAYIVYTPEDCFGTITFRERFGDTVVIGALKGTQRVNTIKVGLEDEVVEYYEPSPTGTWEILDTNLTLIRVIEW